MNSQEYKLCLLEENNRILKEREHLLSQRLRRAKLIHIQRMNSLLKQIFIVNREHANITAKLKLLLQQTREMDDILTSMIKDFTPRTNVTTSQRTSQPHKYSKTQ